LATALFSTQVGSQQLTLDPDFNAGVTDAVATNSVAVLQPDGKILVGGDFTVVNGRVQSGIARLNPDGATDLGFNYGGTGPNGYVGAILLLPDGKIVIGGNFTSYNGIAASGLTRLNSDGTLDLSFNTGGTGVFGDSSFYTIRSLVLQPDGKMVAGGLGINGYNGTSNKGLFRVNSDGSLDQSFVSGFQDYTYLEGMGLQSDGKLVIGLDEGTTYNGAAVTSLLRVGPDGSLDASFNSPNADEYYFFAIRVLSDDRLLVGGNFYTYNGIPRPGIARLNANGTLDQTFVPSEGGLFIKSLSNQTEAFWLVVILNELSPSIPR
jgi:uncharacterized delta-60 repeat protein